MKPGDRFRVYNIDPNNEYDRDVVPINSTYVCVVANADIGKYPDLFVHNKYWTSDRGPLCNSPDEVRQIGTFIIKSLK